MSYLWKEFSRLINTGCTPKIGPRAAEEPAGALFNQNKK